MFVRGASSESSAELRRGATQHVLPIGRCGLWGNPPAKVRKRTEAVSSRREILSNIREFWIALANERPLLSEQDLAAEIEVISDFHATLDRNNHA